MKPNKELDQLAASLAEQVVRRGDGSLEWAAHRIRNAFRIYEERLEDLAAKSEPKSPISSYGDRGREEHRTHNLKTWTGYGRGCDVCGGGFDVDTFMTLSIGSHRAKLMIDLCLPCTKRLAGSVDARLEDKRRKS